MVKPLTSSTSDCIENRRPMPATGLRRSNLGCSAWTEKLRPPSASGPISAAKKPAASIGSTTMKPPSASSPSQRPIASALPRIAGSGFSAERIQTWASAAMPLPAPISTMTPKPTTIALASSRERGSSPRSRASRRRLGVACSVFSPLIAGLGQVRKPPCKIGARTPRPRGGPPADEKSIDARSSLLAAWSAAGRWHPDEGRRLTWSIQGGTP